MRRRGATTPGRAPVPGRSNVEGFAAFGFPEIVEQRSLLRLPIQIGTLRRGGNARVRRIKFADSVEIGMVTVGSSSHLHAELFGHPVATQVNAPALGEFFAFNLKSLAFEEWPGHQACLGKNPGHPGGLQDHLGASV
jgi:hypothetical protein